MTTFIICVTIITLAVIIHVHKAGKPQYKCSHDMKVEKVAATYSSVTFLSTCKKCGYQKHHKFGD